MEIIYESVKEMLRKCQENGVIWLRRHQQVYREHPIPQGFSSFVLKPYVKGVTHSEELGWWSFSMVDCVTLF